MERNITNITILIGNGLGMALDKEHFKIVTGMKKAWNEIKKHKVFIKKIQVLSGKKILLEEEDLQIPHDEYMKFLNNNFENKNSRSELIFERKYHDYRLYIAKHFYNYTLSSSYEFERYNGFVRCFCELIKLHCSEAKHIHVATLNFDALLYTSFIDNKIIGNYLYDGLTDSGFEPKYLENKQNCRYLHLHGSPLFYIDQDEQIKKNTYKQGKSSFKNFELDEEIRPYLVLCHPNQKKPYIEHSKLLKAYFNFFEESLKESELLIIIGYSGRDGHINEAIANRANSNRPFSIVVIEYDKSQNAINKNGKEFWKDTLNLKSLEQNLRYKPMKNILDFDFNTDQ